MNAEPTVERERRTARVPRSRRFGRRRVNRIVTIERRSADQDWKCRAVRGATVRLHGPMESDGRCGGLRWSSRFQRVCRIPFPDPLRTSAAGPHDES